MTPLEKAMVAGYSRQDGTYVKPHNNGRQAATPKVHHHFHPRLGEKGKPVALDVPHKASAASTWHNPQAVATFVPDGDVPASLNGIPLREWRDHPTTADGWDYVDGVDEQLDEPEFHAAKGKVAASGVVIQESDGRVWLVAPSNAFGGYEATFPKGGAEPGLSLQANAIKEAFEESGLQVRITGCLGDFERTTSKARMYLAQRVGGTPIAMGWESQAVHLVPKDKLYDLLNMSADHAVAEAIGATGVPVPKAPPAPKKRQGNLW